MKLTHILVFSKDAKLLKELPENYANHTHLNTVESLQLELEKHYKSTLLILTLNKETAIPVLDAIKPYTHELSILVILDIPPNICLTNQLLPIHPYALIAYPFTNEEISKAIKQGLDQEQHRLKKVTLKQDLAEANTRLNQRLQEINTIYSVGKSVAASLDVQEVLNRVVTASVNLTQSEEGFILLEEENKLYLRISKNMNDNLVQRLNVEAADPIAWQVIRSGRPTMLHRETKIVTGYLVRALLYVPLLVAGRGAIGVLGVVNSIKNESFSENHLYVLSSVAEFAASALENARLFSAVEAEKSRLRAILQHAAEAILVTDTQNRLLLWSKTAADTFEITPAAQNQPIRDHIKHPVIKDLFYQANGGNSKLHAEVAFGNEKVFNAQLSSIRNTGRVAIMQDITHLKELDRLKSEFVSTVSHDLRTPLTTVQGYVELLERVGPLSEMQQNFIQKAMTSLRQITALITDLLDIGRIEAGYDLDMAPCRIDEIIEQTTESYTIQAEQENMRLELTISQKPLWIQGNPRRLRQVLENLITNALKYNRRHGWIRIAAHQDGQHIIIRVQDNGIGIPLEEQPKIFERFYRVLTPETEEIQGTGLGLAIVKSVIEKHKGRVWVESTPGKGSTFAFVLPLYSDPRSKEKR